MEHQSSGTYVIDSQYNIVSYNDTAHQIYPQLVMGEKCYKVLMGLDEPCGPCPVANGIMGPRTYVDPIRNIAETVDAVEVPIEGHGLCHALVFSTVGVEAEIATTLPNTISEIKNLAMIKSFTADYNNLIIYDIPNNIIQTVYAPAADIDVEASMNSGKTFDDVINEYIDYVVHPDDREELRSHINLASVIETLKEKEVFSVHYRVLIDNEVHYYFVKTARIGDADNFECFACGYACEDEDIKLRQKSDELAEALNVVEYDSITGLLTKEAFFLRADEILVDNEDVSYDLIMLKINNLTAINHQFGRNIGDEVLKSVAVQLKESAENNMSLAHMGDGRFLSIARNKDEEIRYKDIEQFKNSLIQICPIKNLSLKWSVYKNIDRNIPLEEIYDRARAALSLIRHEIGRDYVWFDKEIAEKLEREQQIELEFENAINNEEFIVHYQPKYDVKTRKIAGAEALVRWQKPDGSLVSPGVFIPVLERSARIFELDKYVFTKVCQLQAYLKENGIEPIPVSVNLSRASMSKEDIAKIYYTIAQSYGVSTELMPIEITESIAVRAQSVCDFAEAFVNYGFKLHMDDFGAGYSSLASLHILPFEAIKLDKTLIDFIGNFRGESLLKHTISFAKESGMTVVAEGVEQLEQVMFLRVAGCDYIQGYYYSSPVPKAKYIVMLQEQNT